MTWMRLESTLRTHPKIGRLARALGVSRVQAIGHVVALWTWVLDYAPDGDLEAFDEGDLAEAAMWEGDPSTFVGALSSTLLLDVDHVENTLRVHGWMERADRLKSASRKQKERASRRVTPVSRACPSGSRPDETRRDETGRTRRDETGRSIGGDEDITSSPEPSSGAVVNVVEPPDVTSSDDAPEQLELVAEATRGTKSAATRARIDRVVEHYRSHHPQARPGERERKLVRERLAEGYSVEALCRAIDGNTASPFHRGENDRQRPYQSLELIMRSADKVTAFLALADEHCDAQGRARHAPVLTERTRRNVRAAEAWLAEEDRHART